MYSIDVEESGTVDILRELDYLANLQTDLEAIHSTIVDAIHDANRADRLDGVDKDGIALAPLAASTLKSRKGTGPPLAEHGPDARVIRNLVVDLEFEPNLMSIRLMWPGCEWLKYHADGSGRLPVRDILGMRPMTIALLDAIVVAESDYQLAEGLKEAGRGSGIFKRFRNLWTSP
ncbi:MAG: hypothetical protein JWN86_1424 [Planctomycetota bacterium]|nr:hypothetical protein [Planctomycetota bacterium]